MNKGKLLHPHRERSGIEVMIDSLDDNLRRLKRDLDELPTDCLYWQIDTQANSIGVIAWHIGRLTDVFTTQLALGLPPTEACWFRCGWADRTGYDPRGLGRDGWGSLNGYTPEEVAAIPRFTKAQLLGFIEDVYQMVREHLESTSWGALASPGTGFNGAFTRYQIISMALMDNIRHLGEIRLIRACWERRG